jgi:hypothetical protein
MELWCVTCLAACWNDTGYVRQATMILDGRTLCDDHGLPMIKVIAERMISDEPGNDAGQG